MNLRLYHNDRWGRPWENVINQYLQAMRYRTPEH